MEHSENTRVKIPALVHLTRLGYKYLSLKKEKENIDEDINIFKNIFCESINRINGTNYSLEDTEKIINELKILLNNDDLGKAFYIKSPTDKSFSIRDAIKSIEFEITSDSVDVKIQKKECTDTEYLDFLRVLGCSEVFEYCRIYAIG